MEMHQVRYFLAVARTLNFTRAAEECHVAQPSLTRMLPLLKQCYDSALSARTLASAIKSGEVGSLRLAISQTIDPKLVMPHVVELEKLFNGLEFKLMRGNANDVLGYLKRGDVELGLGASIGEEWERLDSWPLFTEDFQLVVNSAHRLAAEESVPIAELQKERLIIRNYCESTAALLDLLRSREFDVARYHETSAESDLLALLDAGVGVALVPRSTNAPNPLVRIVVSELDFSRTVYLYGVAGRQRTPVASALMKMLRAFDWSRFSA
jgi:DNA-binding transcriptional LysR family regulator